jgi:hypothetical protein
VAAVGLLTTWWDWYGIFGGIAAFWLLRKIGQFIIRRLHSHANFAQWGGYLNPGAKIDVKLAPPTRGPRVLDTYDADADGAVAKDWLLADGTYVDRAVGGLETTPDGRYTCARHDLQASSFTLYDLTEHISYFYAEDDAPEEFIRLFKSGLDRSYFSTGSAGPGSLSAFLDKTKRTPMVASRGLWLENGDDEDEDEDENDDEEGAQPLPLTGKTLAPGLVLSATHIGPADLRTAASPIYWMYVDVHRLTLNGFATPFLFRDLAPAVLSSDGKSLMVKGCVVNEDLYDDGARWHYRGADGVWFTLDAIARKADSSAGARLEKLLVLTATEALFSLQMTFGARHCWIQASSRALPFRVPIIRENESATCVVPLKQFT